MAKNKQQNQMQRIDNTEKITLYYKYILASCCTVLFNVFYYKFRPTWPSSGV
jgi:hypothetical protein